MKAVDISIEALDFIIDENMDRLPLEVHKINSRDYRNVGLGCMGISTALFKLGIRYGSKESKEFIDILFKRIFKEAFNKSVSLAKEKGKFPKYKDCVLDSRIVKLHFSEDELTEAKEYGLRNCSLISIAPCGSIATMLGVTGGCEPEFAIKYTRRTDNLDAEYDIYCKEAQYYMNKFKVKTVPDYFVCSSDINWKDRIDMQANMQIHVDTAISSTVNLPNSATKEEIEQLYLYAWEKKLKGTTIFRDGCKRLGVLTVNPVKEDKQKYDFIEPISRKKMGTTHGSTYCKKCACGTLYITVNRDEEGHIVECFVHTSKGGICQANISAINRMASLCMRSGVKIDEIIDQLKSINCPACVKVKTKGEHLDGMSCPDIMARVINEFKNSTLLAQKSVPVKEEDVENDSNKKCPDCGEEIVNEGGCVVCKSCGYSKCG